MCIQNSIFYTRAAGNVSEIATCYAVVQFRGKDGGSAMALRFFEHFSRVIFEHFSRVRSLFLHSGSKAETSDSWLWRRLTGRSGDRFRSTAQSDFRSVFRGLFLEAGFG